MKSINLIKPYFLEKRFLIFFGLICLIIVDFLQLFIPRIIKWTVDDITALKVDLIELAYYAFYIVAIAILIGLFRYGWRRCLIGTSRRVEEGLRNRLFDHIQTLSASFFDKARTGDIMAHATNDIQHIRMATGMGMVALTDAIVLGSAAIGFMAYINVRLTLFVLIPMPMIIFGTRFFSKKMHRLYQEVQGTFSDLTEVVRERFAGIRIIKAYNREKEERSRLAKISNDYINSNLRLVRITGAFFPMMLLFSNISLAIVLYLGGRQTIGLTITPGDFVAFISYLGLLAWPMMAMGWVTNLLQRGRASLDRIDKILQVRPGIDDLSGAEHLKLVQGNIVFENVMFSYGHDKKPVLTGIDIKLDKGKALGIVGPPGSGKTTFANLIPRLFDVTGGRITLDEKDIRNILLKDLRAQISFMPQEPFLFAGTIRENILFGNKEADEKELAKAVKDASLYSTIKSFPEGFDTIIGERGVVLSGGQKQRIALARALLRDRPILILDDPISQVDMETGSAIIDIIKSLTGIKTVIIVSHRLSAVRFADQIIVLDSGRIVESGTHAELIKNDRYYAKTFRLQEIEEELDAY
ncbi:MAG: ABC transporter ATP-binding protein/permease [Desulfobacteraceae bacterium]|nr:ABC transporter ATP-binding protein/permease [Pseudomonadota bacterium]MBU4257947.1 ABC transporter ATP-binding protein/permease [Pseudomonadota bacterium]MBU4413834.1 ABC transporter ATP-binding protein/permease [Pseudomonadota bacterium]MCG2758485.1 ABC transporter ATP-binding protein/permease [Desulfobacteraceae bacterium]